MTGLLFGTGGIPHSSRTNSTIDGIERIAELGLGCMEIEFVQGVRMGEAGARLVASLRRQSSPGRLAGAALCGAVPGVAGGAGAQRAFGVARSGLDGGGPSLAPGATRPARRMAVVGHAGVDSPLGTAHQPLAHMGLLTPA